MMKRILLLSDINSAHTQKWSKGLAKSGYDIGIFSLSIPSFPWFSEQNKISVFAEKNFSKQVFKGAAFSKLQYITSLNYLKKIIKEFKPGIIHAHYATSYGLLGTLSSFHPIIISAWGSDIMEFPGKNFLHKKLLSYNLERADRIQVTSTIMRTILQEEFKINAVVIPYGINLENFYKEKAERPFSENDIVIGTVKSLEYIYGIDILIRAFKIVCDQFRDISLKLLIVGSGSQEKVLKELSLELGLQGKVKFMAAVEYENVNKIYNYIDIFANLSRNESFGVSVLEASASEKPVVVTAVGGLPEVVENNVTGIIVPVENPAAAASAFKKLILEKELRNTMGKNGRKKVETDYDFKKCLLKQIEVYDSLSD
jgi:L-malate glycosyltransferase